MTTFDVETHGENVRHEQPFIVFDRVSKIFHTKKLERVEAIRDISFSVPKDQFITIVGPSGCGKSTLLRMLAGLTKPSTGEIKIDQNFFKRNVDNVGIVFQRPALLPWRNVLDNVLLPAIIVGARMDQAREQALALLKLVGLADFATKYPNELSGGMQQRAGICRALLCQPALLLMDEPFAALDALTREDLALELLRIWQDEPKTVLFVTHSISEAILLSDRVIVISPRPGMVSGAINIEISRPRNPETMQMSIFQEYMTMVRSLIKRY